MFDIRLGVPEMEEYWERLRTKVTEGTASKAEMTAYKQLGKTMKLISENPQHPGLRTHEIKALSIRYGQKVWQSDVNNNTPSAGRMFWVYGPARGQITIIGIEPHPEDTKQAYRKITLSATPDD